MAEPPTIEQRTYEALQTLQQHKAYCSNLEREYLHKHEEVKMYVEFITKINTVITDYILDNEVNDDKLTKLFLDMIEGLKLSGKKKDDLGTLLDQQNRWKTKTIETLKRFKDILEKNPSIKDKYDLTPKILKDSLAGFHQYNNRYNTLDRENINQLGGALGGANDNIFEKHRLVNILYKWKNSNTECGNFLKKKIEESEYGTEHNFFKITSSELKTFIDNINHEISLKSLEIPLINLTFIPEHIGPSISPLSSKPSHSPGLTPKNNNSLKEYVDTYRTKITNYIDYCTQLNKNYLIKHNFVKVLYEYIQDLSHDLNELFQYRRKDHINKNIAYREIRRFIDDNYKETNINDKLAKMERIEAINNRHSNNIPYIQVDIVAKLNLLMDRIRALSAGMGGPGAGAGGGGGGDGDAGAGAGGPPHSVPPLVISPGGEGAEGPPPAEIGSLLEENESNNFLRNEVAQKRNRRKRAIAENLFANNNNNNNGNNDGLFNRGNADDHSEDGAPSDVQGDAAAQSQNSQGKNLNIFNESRYKAKKQEANEFRRGFLKNLTNENRNTLQTPPTTVTVPVAEEVAEAEPEPEPEAEAKEVPEAEAEPVAEEVPEAEAEAEPVAEPEPESQKLTNRVKKGASELFRQTKKKFGLNKKVPESNIELQELAAINEEQENEVETTVESGAEALVEPKPEAAAETKPEAAAETKPEAAAEPEAAETEPEAIVESGAEPEVAVVEPQPKPEQNQAINKMNRAAETSPPLNNGNNNSLEINHGGQMPIDETGQVQNTKNINFKGPNPLQEQQIIKEYADESFEPSSSPQEVNTNLNVSNAGNNSVNRNNGGPETSVNRKLRETAENVAARVLNSPENSVNRKLRETAENVAARVLNSPENNVNRKLRETAENVAARVLNSPENNAGQTEESSNNMNNIINGPPRTQNRNNQKLAVTNENLPTLQNAVTSNVKRPKGPDGSKEHKGPSKKNITQPSQFKGGALKTKKANNNRNNRNNKKTKRGVLQFCCNRGTGKNSKKWIGNIVNSQGKRIKLKVGTNKAKSKLSKLKGKEVTYQLEKGFAVNVQPFVTEKSFNNEFPPLNAKRTKKIKGPNRMGKKKSSNKKGRPGRPVGATMGPTLTAR